MGLANEIESETVALKITKLNAALDCCTPAQQAFYGRLFPEGPSDEQLPAAIRLVEATLKQNEGESE